MSGRRPGAPSRSLRSPWLGEGKTLAAKRLSGFAISVMGSGRFGRGQGLAQPALLADQVPGGIDRRESLRRDRHGLLGEAARDLAVGMGVGHQTAIEPL